MKSIHNLANQGLNENFFYRLRAQARLETPIGLKELFPAFLGRETEKWKELNPNLIDEQIEQLTGLLIDHLSLHSRIDQCEEALLQIKEPDKALSDTQIQNIAAILDKKRKYEPVACPELLIYEYATGKILRPRQAEILKWIFSTRDPERIKQLLFEFEVGGGKTKASQPS